MANSTNLVDYVTVTTGGTTADLGTQPADNCYAIIVLNTDATNAALVGIVNTGTALTSANSALITAGASLTLRIGTMAYRPNGSFSAGPQRLRVKNNGAGTPVLNFQLQNASQAVGP